MSIYPDSFTSPDLDGLAPGADECREDEPSIGDVCRDALIGARLLVSNGAPEAGVVMLVPNQEPDRAANGMLVGFARAKDCSAAWLALVGAGLVVASVGPVWIEVAWPGDVLEDALVVDVMARRAA